MSVMWTSGTAQTGENDRGTQGKTGFHTAATDYGYKIICSFIVYSELFARTWLSPVK